MAAIQRNDDELIWSMRWCARAAGLVAIVFFALFTIESGLRALWALPWASPAGKPMLLALTVAVIGVLIAWRLEAIGGAMTLVGSLAIVFLVYVQFGTARVLPAVIMAAPLLIAGALFVACTCCRLITTRPNYRASTQANRDG